MLLRSRAEALAFPTGDIVLAFCECCGFIFNSAYDPEMRGYSSGYEEQQSFSTRFNEFSRELVSDLIDRYGLKGKKVLEIGCGKGDFLATICELGGNEGVGIDPTCDPQRISGPAKAHLKFIQDYYSQEYASIEADLVCCRHTLEHIPDTRDFLRMIRRSIGYRRNPTVFLEVPDIGRVLREVAFWDIYYEHCSYFTLDSLIRLFEGCDFSVLRAHKGFDNQYLLLDAQPVAGSAVLNGADGDPEQTARDISYFKAHYAAAIESWRRLLRDARDRGKRVAIWGSSSKCVSFLTTMGITDEIDAVVDINPYRHGKFLAGSGAEVCSPECLRLKHPDIVIIMNPIYREEIRRDLQTMGIGPEIVAV